MLNIAEVLCHGQTGQRDTKTGPRRLIHLSEDQCRLIEDTSLFHFVNQVVTFTSTLTNASENRNTTVVLSNTLNHFLNQNGLAHTCATEEANLATLNIWGEQIDDLDTRFEHLRTGLKLVECRRLAMNGPAFGDFQMFTGLKVQDLTGHVEDVTLRDIPNRNRNRSTGIGDNRAANHTISRFERNRTNEVVTEVLSNLKSDRLKRVFAFALPGKIHVNVQCVVQGRNCVRGELNIDNRSDNTCDPSLSR